MCQTDRLRIHRIHCFSFVQVDGTSTPKYCSHGAGLRLRREHAPEFDGNWRSTMMSLRGFEVDAKPSKDLVARASRGKHVSGWILSGGHQLPKAGPAYRPRVAGCNIGAL